MKIGKFETKPSNDIHMSRLSFLLWGLSGCGKTTLAATLPGRKLLINLDPDGTASLSQRDDVDVLDLSSVSTDELLVNLKSADNPLGLANIFKDGEIEYESVILDSLTSLSQRALESSVRQGIGKSSRFVPTMEVPGLSAYGARNAIILECVKGLLRVTGRYNKHFLMVSHEDEPKISESGEIMYITMMLGGKSVSNIALQISEVWWIREDKGKRYIAIRPCRQRKPMKTRMFVTDKDPEFPLVYDPEKDNPLSDFIDQWKTSGKKLPLPTKTS